MSHLPNPLRETPSQTAGPYVHIGLIPKQAGFEIFENNFDGNIAGPKVKGEPIRIEGRIFDGAGAICKDVLIELWQANGEGKYNHPADQQKKSLDPNFRGWGRTGTDFASGLYAFNTIKPGPVIGRSGSKLMAPHVSLWFVSRGINIGLATRMYFSDEVKRNAEDPVLNLIDPILRETLIGKREQRGSEVVYVFDIHIHGPKETVFFDV